MGVVGIGRNSELVNTLFMQDLIPERWFMLSIDAALKGVLDFNPDFSFDYDLSKKTVIGNTD